MASVKDLENDAVFDYIVCGGGTTGCVVAARLAETPGVSVLLIEAGQHNSLLENTQMVGGWSKNFDSDADWNIITEKNHAANDRQIKVSRGRFLGGSSGCNGTLCVRGTRQDFDNWEIPGWSGDEFWPYMSKAENFHPKDWFEHDAKSHGTTGFLHTEPFDLCPISNRILESMQSQGLPYEPDMFSTGKTVHGCGHVVRTHWKGLRSTSADFVKDSNVIVITETIVDKIILEDQGVEGPKAVAVKVIGKDGKEKIVKAKKEIIVSGGAYCSPAILLRSGIGAKEEVEKFGIKSLVNLPGVGKNLQDHLIAFIFYETEEPGLTTDHLLYHDNALAETYRLWKEEKTGALSTFPFGPFAYARLDERLKDVPLWRDAPRKEGRDPMGLTKGSPNIEFFSTECYGGPKQYNKFPVGGKHAFSIIPELFAAQSRGSVTLKSADPKQNPVVDHNYLDHPLDLLVLAEACRFGNEIIVKGAGTKDIVKGAWPRDLTHHAYTTIEEWIPYVKENATTCYHPAGTCKMGKADDPLAVLDERLRVRGVKGLRVADVSIMPLLNQGHSQMPAYGIGEKCADLIKEDAGVL